jgi:hypothetical protein
MSTATVTIQPRQEVPLLADECCPALLREPLTASQAADLATHRQRPSEQYRNATSDDRRRIDLIEQGTPDGA